MTSLPKFKRVDSASAESTSSSITNAVRTVDPRGTNNHMLHTCSVPSPLGRSRIFWSKKFHETSGERLAPFSCSLRVSPEPGGPSATSEQRAFAREQPPIWGGNGLGLAKEKHLPRQCKTTQSATNVPKNNPPPQIPLLLHLRLCQPGTSRETAHLNLDDVYHPHAPDRLRVLPL